MTCNHRYEAVIRDNILYIMDKKEGTLAEVTRQFAYSANDFIPIDQLFLADIWDRDMHMKVVSGMRCILFDGYRFYDDNIKDNVQEIYCHGDIIRNDKRLLNAGFACFPNLKSVVIDTDEDDVIIGHTFANKCKNLENFEINADILKVYSEAFSDCAGLKKINLSECTRIYSGAFSGCTGLTSIGTTEKVEKFGHASFYGTCIKEVDISSAVCIDDYAFSDTELECITCNKQIENSCTVELARYAFSGSKLKRYDADKEIIRLGSGCFKDCVDLEYFCFEKLNVNAIPPECFLNTLKLESAVIPGCIRNIQEKAFAGSGIRSIDFSACAGQKVELSMRAFACCDNLESVDLSMLDISVLGFGLFIGCSRLREVALPDKVKEIQSFTFAKCTNLEYIVFGSQISCFARQAFVDCQKLEFISIPYSSNKIFFESMCFVNCPNLKYIILADGQQYGAEIGAFGKDVKVIYESSLG